MSDTQPEPYVPLTNYDPTERIKQVSKELAASLKPEPITSVVSLRKIELEMLELGEQLTEAIQRLNDPSVIQFADRLAIEAEITAITVQLGRYLTAEQVKVDSYHGFLKNLDNLIEQVQAEMDRLATARKALKGVQERVKGQAVYVMGLIGKKRLEGSHGRRLRLQANPVSVEVTDAAAVPDEFVNIHLHMPLDLWQTVMRCIAQESETLFAQIDEATQRSTPEISLSRIKAFIEAGMVCPECNGVGSHWDTTTDNDDPPEQRECSRCEGKSCVPNIVPGARLVKDRMHLRCE